MPIQLNEENDGKCSSFTSRASYIERLAMVGEKQWQHGMAIFCKPFTKAVVRYFDHADAAAARKWLGEA